MGEHVFFLQDEMEGLKRGCACVKNGGEVAVIGLDERKFVETFPNVVASSFLDDGLVVADVDEVVEESFADAYFHLFDGEGLGLSVDVGVALCLEGAVVAVGVGGQADECAHLHHCLVEGAWMLMGNVSATPLFNVAACGGERDVLKDASISSDKAQHVSIYCGVGE